MLARVVVAVCSILLITACDNPLNLFKEQDMSSKLVTLQLGEPADVVLKRLGLDERRDVDHQPVGMNFYKKDFKTGNMPTLRLEHGEYSFEVPNLFGYRLTEIIDKKTDGIHSLSIYWLFHNDSGKKTSHDEARLSMMALLKQLTDLGWRNVIWYTAPRLAGEESYLYRQSHSVYPPDPTYLPDMDAWMKLDTRSSWWLHADGVMLEVSFQRNADYMHPTDNSDYLLMLDVSLLENGATSYFENKEEKDQWRELWVERMKVLKRMRYQKEAELIKQGYHIDTSYQDPLIHPADPVEPDMTKPNE